MKFNKPCALAFLISFLGIQIIFNPVAMGIGFTSLLKMASPINLLFGSFSPLMLSYAVGFMINLSVCFALTISIGIFSGMLEW